MTASAPLAAMTFQFASVATLEPDGIFDFEPVASN
jgi:hypothetical protein